MNQKIKKEAEQLGLEITEYHGFVRGRVWDGEMNHCGAWVFETLPANIDTEEESMQIFAYNINEALEQMRETAEYFKG
jgi:hypothetical protein